MKNRFRILAMVAVIGLMIQLSAPLPLNGQTPRPAAPQIKLLWLGIGGDDPSIETHKQLRAYLDAKGVKYTYVEVPNQRHWWPLWHRHFAEFAQLIFK